MKYALMKRSRGRNVQIGGFSRFKLFANRRKKKMGKYGKNVKVVERPWM